MFLSSSTCFALPHLLLLLDSSSRQPPPSPLATNSFL
ncbi:hypothetical protein SLEP1_g45916 [Rubroshorea leprosula]|uniref:Uncharacterized protein n=1 Tax=Rubroshorea leprosula TaxID=152421 RepID=A0AAV5LKK9_9ROSI|nr:hypothetical protein SLEP1_g45916 [Rubroshorea leprosula]